MNMVKSSHHPHGGGGGGSFQNKLDSNGFLIESKLLHEASDHEIKGSTNSSTHHLDKQPTTTSNCRHPLLRKENLKRKKKHPWESTSSHHNQQLPPPLILLCQYNRTSTIYGLLRPPTASRTTWPQPTDDHRLLPPSTTGETQSVHHPLLQYCCLCQPLPPCQKPKPTATSVFTAASPLLSENHKTLPTVIPFLILLASSQKGATSTDGSSSVNIDKSSVSSIIVDNRSQASSSCNAGNLTNFFVSKLPKVFGSMLVTPRLEDLQTNGAFASFANVFENQNSINEQVLISSTVGEFGIRVLKVNQVWVSDMVAQFPECSVDTTPIKISDHKVDKSLGSVNIWDKAMGLFSCKHSVGAREAEGECRDSFSAGFLQQQVVIKHEQKAMAKAAITKVFKPLVDNAQEDFQLLRMMMSNLGKSTSKSNSNAG